MAQIIEFGTNAPRSIRPQHSRDTPRPQCSCAPTLNRHTFIWKEISELNRNRTASVTTLEDLLRKPADSSLSWDLIYSADMLARLPDIAARQVIKAAAYRSRPGGRVLLANPALDSRTRSCSVCGGAGIIYRNEFEMAALAQLLPADDFPGITVLRGASGSNLYLELYRAANSTDVFSPLAA